MPAYKLIQGDCIEVMSQAKAESIDSIVCDPPYQIDFMGLEFDSPRMLGTARGLSGGFQKYPPGVKRPAVKDGNPLRFQEWCTAWGTEALRVMKPGAYGLAFGSDRTYHRLASGLEDAGFVIRGTMMYVHGQGMPKGQNVSKAIDKMLGAERGDGGRGSANCAYLDRGEECRCGDRGEVALSSGTIHVRATTSTSDEAKQWDGWNSQLKPALEPIVLFQKPFKGSIAKNVLAHGVGALNIDGCRIVPEAGDYDHPGDDNRSEQSHVYGDCATAGMKVPPNDKGRYPSNLILDDAAAELLDAQSGNSPGFSSGGSKGAGFRRDYVGGREVPDTELPATHYNDSGGASRFFYKAKPSKKEKLAGVPEDLEKRIHETTKGIDLMRYLARLVTPPNGTILDCFLGSGTTGCAAMLEGFRFVGVEQSPEYMLIAEARMKYWNAVAEGQS